MTPQRTCHLLGALLRHWRHLFSRSIALEPQCVGLIQEVSVIEPGSVAQSALYTGRILGKFNFGVIMREVVEVRGGELSEADRYLLRWIEDYTESKISLGGGLGSLVKGLEMKTDPHYRNIINTTASYMAVEADAGPLLWIRILEEGGKEICGGVVAGGYRFCMLLRHEVSTASHAWSREVV